MLTANAMDEHKRQAIEAGCDFHVAKPITPAALLGAIETALNGSEKAAIAA
jgi:CheY-like chemotaxis protein